MRRIGFLDTLAADDPETSIRYGAFLQRLQGIGMGRGRNLRIAAPAMPIAFVATPPRRLWKRQTG